MQGGLDIIFTASQSDNHLGHFCSPASRWISLEPPFEAAAVAAGDETHLSKNGALVALRVHRR